MKLNRRELLQGAGAALAASRSGAAESPAPDAAPADWIRTCRALICEAYNPPFYPSLDYQAAKAVDIARQLNADSLRYPAASYFAYFPTKSGYPVHPELKGDPMRETADLCRRDRPQADRLRAAQPSRSWTRHRKTRATRSGANARPMARPMTTEHYGYATLLRRLPEFAGARRDPHAGARGADAVPGGRDVLRRPLPGHADGEGVLPLQALRSRLPEALRQARAGPDREALPRGRNPVHLLDGQRGGDRLPGRNPQDDPADARRPDAVQRHVPA